MGPIGIEAGRIIPSETAQEAQIGIARLGD